MNNIEKCEQLLSQIKDEKIIEQLNILFENLNNVSLDEQTKILNKLIELIKKGNK